ncbi:hypothetical protein OG21DRAFT_1513853 [Imleria badia]|nr:hypothetical protein OG21DRAFT_1513853 [Imleria badia]
MAPLNSRESESISAAAPLQTDPPDLTNTLQHKKRIAGNGSFATVYSCLCVQNGEVTVKAITLPRASGIKQPEKNELIRKTRRELGIWRRLEHPNIIPLLGTARGEDFTSDHPCMVAM